MSPRLLTLAAQNYQHHATVSLRAYQHYLETGENEAALYAALVRLSAQRIADELHNMARYTQKLADLQHQAEQRAPRRVCTKCGKTANTIRHDQGEAAYLCCDNGLVGQHSWRDEEEAAA